jgi:hypothetical protein
MSALAPVFIHKRKMTTTMKKKKNRQEPLLDDCHHTAQFRHGSPMHSPADMKRQIKNGPGDDVPQEYGR